MTRKSLRGEIESVNQRLSLRQEKFRLASEQSTLALQRLNPFLLVGAGLLAGGITGVTGWRKIYSAASAGLSIYPVLVDAMRLMGSSNDG